MRENVELKASTGSKEKGDKKEFVGRYSFPETLEEASDLLGSEEDAVSALNETLTRRYQAQLRGAGKSTKTQQMWSKMVEAMTGKGLSREEAEEVATHTTGYVNIPQSGSEAA